MKTTLKFSLLAGLAFFLAAPLNSSAFHNSDSTKKTEPIIEISSSITVQGTPAAGYDIFLSLDGNIIDSFNVKKAKPLYFELEADKLYALVYKKEGFEDKIVMIDTKVPPPDRLTVYYHIDFEVELAEEVSTQKKDFIEYPVGLIRYDMTQKEFTHSGKYHKEVHHR